MKEIDIYLTRDKLLEAGYVAEAVSGNIVESCVGCILGYHLDGKLTEYSSICSRQQRPPCRLGVYEPDEGFYRIIAPRTDVSHDFLDSILGQIRMIKDAKEVHS